MMVSWSQESIMRKDESMRFTRDVIVVKRMGEREWMFEYPRLTWEVMDDFYEALESWR
jgi:hypothetical protein